LYRFFYIPEILSISGNVEMSSQSIDPEITNLEPAGGAGHCGLGPGHANPGSGRGGLEKVSRFAFSS
jgi:hypothetical protein